MRQTTTPAPTATATRIQRRLATMYNITRCPLVSTALLLGNSAPRPIDLSDFALIVGFLATSYQLLFLGNVDCEHRYTTVYRFKNQPPLNLLFRNQVFTVILLAFFRASQTSGIPDENRA